jgi:hypothetical protein
VTLGSDRMMTIVVLEELGTFCAAKLLLGSQEGLWL